MSNGSINWTNERRKLSELIPWPRNPRQIKTDQAKRLAQSFEQFGQVETIAIGPDNGVYNGHQRLNVLMDKHGGDYEIEVRVSSRALTEKEREKLTVFLHKGAAGEWDFDTLSEWDVPDLIEWGFSEKELQVEGFDFGEVEKEKQPSPRNLPLDLIFTMENYHSQWTPMAYYSGLKWGIQSNSKVLSPNYNPHYKVSFVDNVYTDYDHEEHLAVVCRFKPKYCTVRDIMSERQCSDSKIKYFDFVTILGWAEELTNYAENVIVIPKYDCIADIPDKYILGYSVPTSHGGTPLKTDLFKGRRVHLLGGSWKNQLAYLAEFGDDVVSLDNNHCHRIAEFGQFYLPDGNTGVVQDLLDRSYPNGATIALAISFGSMGAKLNELYSGAGHPDNKTSVVAETHANQQGENNEY